MSSHLTSGSLALVVLVGLFAAACSDVNPVLKVALERPEPGTTPQPRAATQAPGAVVRVALAAVISPQQTARTYEDLVSYLQRRLGRRVEVVQKRTYSEINDLLKTGFVQIGLVCSLPYVVGHDEFGLELLAAPVVGNGAVYFSYLVVPSRSRATSLADLRGGVFAFSDPLSNSGHLAPVYQLSRLGDTPQAFFQRTIFTYGHDNSVRSVADGLVDGAAIDSVVYDSMAAADPAIRRQTRVIARWGPYATAPLVVPPTLDPSLKAALRGIFLSMADDAEGSRILGRLGVERFVTIDDDAYDSIREMWRAVGGEL